MIPPELPVPAAATPAAVATQAFVFASPPRPPPPLPTVPEQRLRKELQEAKAEHAIQATKWAAELLEKIEGAVRKLAEAFEAYKAATQEKVELQAVANKLQAVAARQAKEPSELREARDEWAHLVEVDQAKQTPAKGPPWGQGSGEA